MTVESRLDTNVAMEYSVVKLVRNLYSAAPMVEADELLDVLHLKFLSS